MRNSDVAKVDDRAEFAMFRFAGTTLALQVEGCSAALELFRRHITQHLTTEAAGTIVSIVDVIDLDKKYQDKK